MKYQVQTKVNGRAVSPTQFGTRYTDIISFILSPLLHHLFREIRPPLRTARNKRCN